MFPPLSLLTFLARLTCFTRQLAQVFLPRKQKWLFFCHKIHNSITSLTLKAENLNPAAAAWTDSAISGRRSSGLAWGDEHAADSEDPSWLTHPTVPAKGICRSTPALLTKRPASCAVPPLWHEHRWLCLQWGLPLWGSGRVAPLSAHGGEGLRVLQAADLEPLTLSSAPPQQVTCPYCTFWAQLQVLPSANKIWLDGRKKNIKRYQTERCHWKFLRHQSVEDDKSALGNYVFSSCPASLFWISGTQHDCSRVFTKVLDSGSWTALPSWEHGTTKSPSPAKSSGRYSK